MLRANAAAQLDPVTVGEPDVEDRHIRSGRRDA